MKRLSERPNFPRPLVGLLMFPVSILLAVNGATLSGSKLNVAPAPHGADRSGNREETEKSMGFGTTNYTYSISGKLSLPDYRMWCDPAKNPDAALYRVHCTQLASVALPLARIYAVDATSKFEIGVGVTKQDGTFQISWSSTRRIEPRTVLIETDFTGFPRDAKYPSFQVYANPSVVAPPDLKDVAARKPVRAATNAVACNLRTCNAGDISLLTQANGTLQNVSALYLSLNYVYTDGLYVSAYHDYCMGLAKSGSSCPYDAKYAIVNVSDAATSNQTGNETGFINIPSGDAKDSAILHEFGHALEFWAGKFTPGTSGPYTPLEAWANFVRLAYEYPSDASNVKDYDGYNIEDEEPLCKNDAGNLVPYSQGQSSANCKPQEIGVNWRAAFWDLFDKRQETTRYACEPLGNSGYKGDNMVVTFAKMLDAWRNSLQYGTANHGVAEAPSGDNKSTNNLYDYVYNLSVVSGVPFWQVEQTGIFHACQTGQPSD